MTPKWPWIVQGQRYTIYTFRKYPQVPHFTPFRSIMTHFQDICQFSFTFFAPMLNFIFFFKFFFFVNINFQNSKKNFSGDGHMGTHENCVWKRIISAEEEKKYFRKNDWMTPQWPWLPQGQRYPICVVLLPTRPTFTQFRSTTARFPGNWAFCFLHNVKWWNLNFWKKKR